MIFRNNLPVFSQKTLKDLFNFHLMFSSCLLFPWGELEVGHKATLESSNTEFCMNELQKNKQN